MPITSNFQKVTEEGKEKDAFFVNFTNGALDQLKDLAKHFKQENEEEVVKLGISFLQLMKERNEKGE